MRRLQPLPDRTEQKSAEVHGKDELAKMKQELDGLEKEELVHHQSQLALAQQRLQQKRKSDLAKRMQEAQRLQILKEKRAELDETRRGKLIHFKQRMLFAAEKSVDREALLMDTLYENIGEAMDNIDGDGAESSIVDEDPFAFGGEMGHSGAPLGAAAETLPLIARVPPPQSQPQPMASGFGQLGDPFRIKSAFEDHWTHEQQKYVEQLHALKLMHGAIIPHSTGAAARRLHDLDDDPSQKKTQPPVLALQLNPLLKTFPGAAMRLTKNQQQQQHEPDISSAERPWKYNPAREAHRRVRDELKKLVAQSSEYHDDLSDLVTPPTTPKPSSSTSAPSRQRLDEARSLEARIAKKLNEVEARERVDCAREKLVSASIVPREDLLVKGEFILEDAEANILHKMEQERAERERLEKIERQRSASLVASGVDEFALGRSRSFKSRKVSVAGEGEVLEDERRPSAAAAPGLLHAPGQSATPAVTPTERPITPGWTSSRSADDRGVGRRASLVEVVVNTTAGSGNQEASAGGPNPTALRERRDTDGSSLQTLPKYMQVVTSAEERHQLLVEQANNRFNLRRAAQREELEQLRRKLDLLLTEEQEAGERESATQSTEVEVATLPQGVTSADTAGLQTLSLVSAEHETQPHPTTALADPCNAIESANDLPAAPEDATAVTSTAVPLLSQTDGGSDAAVAAVRIQCAYRCYAARQERDRREADFRAIIEARAKQALEEDEAEQQQATGPDAQLEEEAATLRDLVAREQVIAELSTAHKQAEIEALAAAQRAWEAQEQRRVRAATTIQRVVRGRQVRLWYAKVSAARKSLVLEWKTTSAITIQDACRRYLGRKRTLLTVTSRRQLKQRYDPFVGDARGMGGIAAVCLQCFFRRLVTRRSCGARRAVAKGELRDTQWDEAAGTIQRQWRRYSLQVEERRSIATSLVAATALAASQVALATAVDGESAHSAVTTIAKYVRRFLCRDILRQRWTDRLFVDALAEAESIRREVDAAAALDDVEMSE